MAAASDADPLSDDLRLALAQLNPVVGDLRGNADRILAARAAGAEKGATLVLTPELSVSGYPPEDLVYRQGFRAAVTAELDRLAAATADGGPALLVGAPLELDGSIYNATVMLDGGERTAVVRKHHLPNYGVFDEARVFTPGPLPDPVAFRGLWLGVLICEDMWYPDVAGHLAAVGAQVLLVPNGSPYELDKAVTRVDLAEARAAETGLSVVYLNQVGGQDELAFDGASFVVAPDGRTVVRQPAWVEDVRTTRWRLTGAGLECAAGPVDRMPGREEDLYRALMTGLGDYVRKNGFPGVVLGLSGGIDSALSAAIAADALGPQNVRCVLMPSPYTSRASVEDAGSVAELLGTSLEVIPIGPGMHALNAMLGETFAGRAPDTTEENIQSRLRGLTLMAISNKFGPMVLSTGNKSEMSVGYATLYGDMCGGYNALKDVYKTDVFRLARWRNGTRPQGGLGPDGPVMPERVITKPPTAELRENQKDEDSLPPYGQLDLILLGLVEGQLSIADLAATGHDIATVQKVWTLLQRSEYKRRQAPPGVKVTPLAFGRDRRYPITNRYPGLA